MYSSMYVYRKSQLFINKIILSSNTGSPSLLLVLISRLYRDIITFDFFVHKLFYKSLPRSFVDFFTYKISPVANSSNNAAKEFIN